MSKPRSPTLITLGRLVRAYREAAGFTQKHLAGAIGYTNGWLSNVETAQLRPRKDQVTALEQALSLPPGALMLVAEQLDAEVLPGWFRPWLDEERRATVIRSFELALIPGLLQTPEYAGVLLDDDEKAVQARMERQEILSREDPPRGIVTSSREDVDALVAAWEAVRTFALPQQESLDLIKKVIDEKWT